MNRGLSSMRLKRQLTCLSVLLAILILGPGVLGQDEPTAAGDDAKKWPFALYVEVAYGISSARDLWTSTSTSSSLVSANLLVLDEWTYARAGVGWKLPYGKGDARLIFNGFRENQYEFYALGGQAALDPTSETPANVLVEGPLPWWALEIQNGRMISERFPPDWIAALDDTNVNGVVDLDEVRYPKGVDLSLSRAITDDLQNHTQFIDLLYGRTFGTRRFGARWWTGLRYFAYDGNLPAGAWLGGSEAGEGYTDGSLIPLLNLRQETSGIGATGMMEVDFKFWEERFVMYLQGQVALMMLSLEMDTGPFWVLVIDQDTSIPTPARSHLIESRNKTTWQNALEAGVRFSLKNGLQFEAAYNKIGLLDIMLLPTDLQIPSNPQTAWQGTAALYNTKDHILDSWRFGIAYQF
jgi:hypothetical protein